ncbi:hypothetical protein HXX76_004570 [Chlamydomonas incerta]|uniref:ShKT domain-containing protein n=1 Tax=Chlamydomonas incerta TaxID=51695 RepID=A0A835T5B7_CHLIN|nr:hypothetical protein HXX76_004570 [Chlamydomonas incerta]|eukprot:KAG2439207.1 hypothetical protein HXX76_004570 [Chlamydomonas incerta]
MYSDWQTVGMVFSYKRSRQPHESQITRIMCCTDEERKRYNEQLLSIVKTHVAPSFAKNQKTGDFYAAYNKPGAVYDWLKHVDPPEDWLLVLDSDMYLRRPFYPQFFNATRGWCVSADYTYMVGVNNELATRHIPEVEPRHDTLAGPYGRRGDQVGGFFFMHRDDMKRVAPMWLSYTEDVREDPESWRLTGDQYVEKGGKPWISEMYGYAFGAAKANVWHKWDKKTMMYPTYRPTDCQMYSDWQSVGAAFSFKMSGQPGSVIRVMCCPEEQAKNYNKGLLGMVDTWVAPDASHSKRTGDRYAAYNKPEAVIDWLDHNAPKHDYVLVLDSDMVLRRPFFVENMGPRKGLAVGARYTYMIGVANELAVRHIPHVPPRNDTLAGPFGRRGDQVGGFFFIHKDDLKAMSHDWLKFSEDVRVDDQAYRLSGDVYAIHPGDRPWISEMYGYAFGAANHNVWHKWDTFSMIYPGYEPREGIPKLMHYGLLFEIGKNYSFDKHWHYDFDVTVCPPWDLKDPKRRTHGIFPDPPRPSSLKKDDFIGYYKDLLAIETISTLNAAFCDYHISHCPPSEQLVSVCKEVFSLYNEAREFIQEAEASYDCQDFHPKCAEWKESGECVKNENYMTENCRKTCDKCNKIEKYFPETTTKELEEKLAKMSKELQPLSEDPDNKGGAGSVPKAEAPLVIPKQEQPVTIIPRNEAPPKQEVRAASPPMQSSPPPSPAPIDSPPPTSPPPESPSPVKPPPKKVVTRQVNRAQLDPKKSSQKALMVRCYKLSLGIDEVKDCVKAAKEGKEYEVPKKAAAGKAAEGEEAAPKAKHAESHLTLDGEGAATETGNDEVAKAKAPSTEGAEGNAGKKNIRVVQRDLEDLSLTQGDGKKGKAPVIDAPVVGPSLHALLGHLNTWQALLLWLVVVVAFLALVPRIAKLRRRQRSGMRTE